MKRFICQFVFTILVLNSAFALNSTCFLEDTVQNSSHEDSVHKKLVSIGIPLIHFSPINNNEFDYNIRFISPGIEALFHYPLNNSANFITGISYQYNSIFYGKHSSSDVKTIMNEISIPFLISSKLLQSKGANLNLAAGFYLGQYITISNNITLFEQNKGNYAKLFSKDDFISDVYVAFGSESFFRKIPIGYDLFFRYRLKKHEIVNHEVSRFLYGIKLKYGFNF